MPYPADKVIRPLNNWGLKNSYTCLKLATVIACNELKYTGYIVCDKLVALRQIVVSMKVKAA